MGKRGPKPTPTKTLKLRGSWRANDRKAEPQPDATRPKCPPWLNQEAKATWKQIVPQLADMGVLTKIDGNALARYCDAWARWRKMAAFMDEKGEMWASHEPDWVDKQGEVQKGKIKYLQQFPQVGIYHKLGQMLTRLEAEFGLTPSARAGISVPAGQQGANEDDVKYFGHTA